MPKALPVLSTENYWSFNINETDLKSTYSSADRENLTVDLKEKKFKCTADHSNTYDIKCLCLLLYKQVTSKLSSLKQ